MSQLKMTQKMRSAIRNVYKECTLLNDWIIKRYLDNIDSVLSGEVSGDCILKCCYLKRGENEEEVLHRIANLLNFGKPVEDWSRMKRYLPPGVEDPRHNNEKGSSLTVYSWYSHGIKHVFKTRIGGYCSIDNMQLYGYDDRSQHIYFHKFRGSGSDEYESGNDTEPELGVEIRGRSLTNSDLSGELNEIEGISLHENLRSLHRRVLQLEALQMTEGFM